MSFALILLGRLLQFILALIGVRVATTLLRPEEMGRMSLVLTIIAFFALFLVNPVGMFINRRLHDWVRVGTIRRYLTWYWGYLGAVCLAAAPILAVLALTDAFALGVGLGWLLLLVCGSLFFNTVNQTVLPSLNLMGRPVPFIALTLATVALGLLIASALAIVWRPKAEAWLLGVLIGQLVIGLIGYRVFISRYAAAAPAEPLSRDRLGRLFAFAWPIAVAVGFHWMHLQGYRFLLAERVGLVELGLFVAGYGVAASLLSAMETVLNTHFQPIFYRDAAAPEPAVRDRAWSRYAAALIPSAVLGAAVVVAAAPDLTAVLLGPAFQNAAPFVALGAFAEGARMLIGLFGLMAHYRMRTSALIVPNAVGAGLSIGLTIALLPALGVKAAAVSAGAAGLVVVLHLYLSQRRAARFAIDVRTVTLAALGGGGIVLAAGFLRRWLPSAGDLTHVLGLMFVAACAAPAAWWILRPQLSAAPLQEPGS